MCMNHGPSSLCILQFFNGSCPRLCITSGFNMPCLPHLCEYMPLLWMNAHLFQVNDIWNHMVPTPWLGMTTQTYDFKIHFGRLMSPRSLHLPTLFSWSIFASIYVSLYFFGTLPFFGEVQVHKMVNIFCRHVDIHLSMWCQICNTLPHTYFEELFLVEALALINNLM